MMRVTLVHNPGAGDESHSAKRILKRLTDAGHDATLGLTGKRGISKALEDPGDLVVAAGGDGTIKKVALALAGRGIPLAILPIVLPTTSPNHWGSSARWMSSSQAGGLAT